MSLQLKIDEMLTALQKVDQQSFEAFRETAETLATQLGAALAERIPNITAGEANFEDLDLGGLCCPIRPVDPEQPIPEPLQGLDDSGWE